jgi:hypothetical protein
MVPPSAFTPSRIAGVLRIEAWLCMTHLLAGGPQTPECPLATDAYRGALDIKLSQRR